MEEEIHSVYGNEEERKQRADTTRTGTSVIKVKMSGKK